MKDLQRMAQEDGLMPTMDYSHYQMKDLFKSIGRNTGLLLYNRWHLRQDLM